MFDIESLLDNDHGAFLIGFLDDDANSGTNIMLQLEDLRLSSEQKCEFVEYYWHDFNSQLTVTEGLVNMFQELSTEKAGEESTKV